MKLLIDVGVAASTVQALRDRGHEVFALTEEGLHRLKDPEILSRAIGERRVIIAFDLDFGSLLALGARSFPSVVTLRFRDQTPASVTRPLLDALDLYREELAAGAVLVVEEGRCRLRRLPIRR